MAEQKPSEGDRLNKYLALRLGISRREADNYIEKKRVSLNGAPAVLGARVFPGDEIKVDGKLVNEVAYEYLAFHKPVGYVSSRRAQGDAPTLYELLPEKYHTLKPVGRLDKDSSGLLLLTNDGDFAYQMTHPKFYKVKIYEVQLDRDLEPLHQQMISDYGVQLEDGVSKFIVEKLDDDRGKRVAPSGTSGSPRNSVSWGEPAPTSSLREVGADSATGPASSDLRSEAYDRSGNRALYKITMHEGRNRQIRRTFKALGYTVTKLHRTHFGDYALGDIPPGNYETIKIS